MRHTLTAFCRIRIDSRPYDPDMHSRAFVLVALFIACSPLALAPRAAAQDDGSRKHHKHEKDDASPADSAAAPTPATPAVGNNISAWYMTLHGGTADTILQFDAKGTALPSVLGPIPDSIGTVHGLRGMLRLADDTLLVIAAWKENTQILRFGAPASNGTRPFLSVFAKQDASNPLMLHPYCLAQASDGSIYASNQDTNTITRYAAPSSPNAGTPIDCAGNPSTGAQAGMIVPDAKSSPDGLHAVRGIAFGPDGLLYVADRGDGQVSRWNVTTGTRVDTLLKKKDSDKTPIQLLFTPDGKSLLISDNKLNCVVQVTLADQKWKVLIPESAGIDAASSLAVSGDSLYVGSRKGKEILRFNLADGTPESAPFLQNLPDNPEFFIPGRLGS